MSYELMQILTLVQTRLMSQRVAGVSPVVATGVASLLLTLNR
ncbi:MAG: hypothetical protein RM347_025565 [Nostoc sp. ChiQUE02]|nr:hypothetical protein [Nostoc sp. ChiQUE02]